MLVNPVWANPYLQSAIQIVDQLADLGKTLPFVAPAFILLKVIIEIEKKAQDADVKCNDLLERITFMLGHLPVLRRLKVMDATRQVVERMNEALQDAAALITAYRKQGRVVRRLRMNNRDKFTACVEAINSCSKDLMVSLQIHQTEKLDILTRQVPMDKEDEAAQEFVSSHGNYEVVSHSPELVKEFAQQQHLQVNDQVMEQLNVNFVDTIKQTHIQLANMLGRNVSTALVDGIKSIVTELHSVEAEQQFKCVQCDKSFIASANGPKSCSFHKAEYSSWNKNFPCCGITHPCQFSSHRASHHCDYPYGAFFPYSQGITRYIDTVEKWLSIEDCDLEGNHSPQKASVGKLLRRVSRGDLVKEPTILITVGTIWHTERYFFDTFTAEELKSTAEVVAITRQNLIYKTSESISEYAMAEWEVSSGGGIIGIRLTAKSVTSENPSIRVCHFDMKTCTQKGDIIIVSEGGIQSYRPMTPYVLPETTRVCPELSDEPLRPVRTDFKTHKPSSLRVILKTMSDPPLTANPDIAGSEIDYFDGEISVFNNNPLDSQTSVTIGTVSAAFRLVGDDHYTPVKSIKIVNSPPFPLDILPRQSVLLKFRACVPRSEEDKSLQITWWNRAVTPRHRPLRLKVIFEDIEGDEFSMVLEYVFSPFRLDKLAKDDVAFFYYDDVWRINRNGIHVRQEQDCLSINSISMDTARLDKIVYNAVKTGETEIDLGIGQEKDYGSWEWAAWALVDLSCRCVYAFKIIIKEGNKVQKKTLGCVGYVPCPTYGKVLDERRPIRYAQEIVKLPPLDQFVTPKCVVDDTFDDIVSATANGSTQPTSNTNGTQFVLPENMIQRLDSIDSNLSRIAGALERLVDAFQVRK